MLQEFWVIGGRYRDVDFSALEDGGGELYGPFASYDEAHRSWVDRTRATRSLAEVRYQIVATADRTRATRSLAEVRYQIVATADRRR